MLTGGARAHRDNPSRTGCVYQNRPQLIFFTQSAIDGHVMMTGVEALLCHFQIGKQKVNKQLGKMKPGQRAALFGRNLSYILGRLSILQNTQITTK